MIDPRVRALVLARQVLQSSPPRPSPQPKPFKARRRAPTFKPGDTIRCEDGRSWTSVEAAAAALLGDANAKLAVRRAIAGRQPTVAGLKVWLDTGQAMDEDRHA